MVTVVGGKYTTYRTMASDAVDACAGPLGRSLPPSPTADVPLVGAAGWQAVRNRADASRARPVSTPTRCGGCWAATATRCPTCSHRYAPSPRSASRSPASPATSPPSTCTRRRTNRRLTLTDVLTRRTHVAIEQRDSGEPAAADVAALVAPVLGWDQARQAREVDDYMSSLRADRAALTDP